MGSLLFEIFIFFNFYFVPVVVGVAFYNEENYIGHSKLYQDISTTCENLPDDLNQNVESVNTCRCLLLYPSQDCQNTPYEVLAGLTPSLSTFSNQAISFRGCHRYDEEILRDNQFDVTFYREPDFKYTTRFSYSRASTSCQNIQGTYARDAESLKTSKCIVLYDEEECTGDSQEFQAGSYSNLGTFRNKLVSFKACTKYDDEEEYHVIFYKNGNYTGIVDDVDVRPGCNDVYTDTTEIKSVDTPVCVMLFEDYQCTGVVYRMINPGGHTSLPDYIRRRVRSVRPCVDEDVNRFPSTHEFSAEIIEPPPA